MSAEVATAPAAFKAVKPGFEETGEAATFPIRMTLSSTKMKAVEQGKFLFSFRIHFRSPPPSNFAEGFRLSSSMLILFARPHSHTD